MLIFLYFLTHKIYIFILPSQKMAIKDSFIIVLQLLEGNRTHHITATAAATAVALYLTFRQWNCMTCKHIHSHTHVPLTAQNASL